MDCWDYFIDCDVCGDGVDDMVCCDVYECLGKSLGEK